MLLLDWIVLAIDEQEGHQTSLSWQSSRQLLGVVSEEKLQDRDCSWWLSRFGT